MIVETERRLWWSSGTYMVLCSVSRMFSLLMVLAMITAVPTPSIFMFRLLAVRIDLDSVGFLMVMKKFALLVMWQDAPLLRIHVLVSIFSSIATKASSE